MDIQLKASRSKERHRTDAGHVTETLLDLLPGANVLTDITPAGKAAFKTGTLKHLLFYYNNTLGNDGGAVVL